MASTSPSAGSACGARWAAPTAAIRPSRSYARARSTGTGSSALEGARWFHCGGIFAALGDHTADVATEALTAARRHGTIVSYDLNYRPSLWRSVGGQERAREVNRAVAPLVDVMLGNEEDFSAALGFEVAGVDRNLSALDPEHFGAMMEQVVAAYPNIRVVATTLRTVLSASRNDWSAVCWADGVLYRSVTRPGLEILDRVGGGDSFASGLIYGCCRAPAAEGTRLRRGPRGARHDHAGRYLDGHPRRSLKAGARRLGQGAAMTVTR